MKQPHLVFQLDDDLDQEMLPAVTSDGTRLLAPAGRDPASILTWFESISAVTVPLHDGSLRTARLGADAFARQAKAHNTLRAYRASIRAWCGWCAQHGLSCLPAREGDIAAFLADERMRGRSVTTIGLRRAALRYMHRLAGIRSPTGSAEVSETLSGIRRAAAHDEQFPRKKAPVTAELLRRILASVVDDLPGLRDRAMILVGFTAALRRSELARIKVEHITANEAGLSVLLPVSKGERAGRTATVALPRGRTELCPVRAIARWREAAGITEGPLFRRIWRTPTRNENQVPIHVVGHGAMDSGSVARMLKGRIAAAGFDASVFSGHSLRRGVLNEGLNLGVHPKRLKDHARHKSYAALDEYLERGDPFETHPMKDVL